VPGRIAAHFVAGNFVDKKKLKKIAVGQEGSMTFPSGSNFQ